MGAPESLRSNPEAKGDGRTGNESDRPCSCETGVIIYEKPDLEERLVGWKPHSFGFVFNYVTSDKSFWLSGIIFVTFQVGIINPA